MFVAVPVSNPPAPPPPAPLPPPPPSIAAPPPPPPATTKYSTVSGGVVVNDIDPVPAVNLVYFSAAFMATVSAVSPVPTFKK
jgi:hypothetical protein